MSQSTASQEKILLQQAQEKGVSNNYFFKTTFERYKVQLQILRKLKTEIRKHGPTVVKEYVKGRENIVANPAIQEYNKTATAANNTVTTLINIMQKLTEDTKQSSKLEGLIASLNSPDYEEDEADELHP